MVCKVCAQLQDAVASSQMPDEPHLLLGLSEAGLRNRARQKEERSAKAVLDLERHRRSCRELGEKASV